MAAAGVIEPSNSPWTAPAVLVRKKDQTWRFCVDYRRLNYVTRKDSYPLPQIDNALDKIAGSRLFSSLDLLSGYWQVHLMPEGARQDSVFNQRAMAIPSLAIQTMQRAGHLRALNGENARWCATESLCGVPRRIAMPCCGLWLWLNCKKCLRLSEKRDSDDDRV